MTLKPIGHKIYIYFFETAEDIEKLFCHILSQRGHFILGHTTIFLHLNISEELYALLLVYATRYIYTCY